ncbi:hypothetical protein [Burkholderia humptydooensis]|uniref:hypothetical protein n=1 Tax=Burkholderia sp. 2002721687 TaxID=1468409 RepID=UPI001F3FC5A8|nr:hypothetical protein [Burkholderia sp. 2002721687]
MPTGTNANPLARTAASNGACVQNTTSWPRADSARLTPSSGCTSPADPIAVTITFAIASSSHPARQPAAHPASPNVRTGSSIPGRNPSNCRRTNACVMPMRLAIASRRAPRLPV